MKMKNPPIEEAVISVRLEVPCSDDVSLFKVPETMMSFYKEVGIINNVQTKVVKNGMRVSSFSEEKKIGVHFSSLNDEGQFRIRFFNNGFFVHVLKPYPGFERLVDEFKRVLKWFAEWMQIDDFFKIRFQMGVRNIDKIDISPGQNVYDVFTGFDPSIKSALSLTGFLNQEKGFVKGTKLEAKIIKSFQQIPETSNSFVVLDTEVLTPLSNHTKSTLDICLKDLRKIKNQIFEESIVESIRKELS